MLEAFMPEPMFPGRDGGPRAPGWFMNWLLYAWFGAIWKEELIWKTKWVHSTISELIVNVANRACEISLSFITGPYWFISLFWVSCSAATAAVAVAVAVAAAAATAAAAAAAAGWVKSEGGRE